MKKYACNRLYKASGEWMPQSVVSINERGEVESYAPLKEETLAASPIYQNIPVMDPNVVGTPMLR